MYWGGYQIFWKFINPWSVILHLTHKFTLQNKLYTSTDHYCIPTRTYDFLAETTWEHLSNWQDQPSQSTVKTAEYEAQLLLHCSFTKMWHNFQHGDWRSNIISFLWCQNKEVRVKFNAYMPFLAQGVKKYRYTSSWPWHQMGELVTPPTANLPPGKRPGMHCGGN